MAILSTRVEGVLKTLYPNTMFMPDLTSNGIVMRCKGCGESAVIESHQIANLSLLSMRSYVEDSIRGFGEDHKSCQQAATTSCTHNLKRGAAGPAKAIKPVNTAPAKRAVNCD